MFQKLNRFSFLVGFGAIVAPYTAYLLYQHYHLHKSLFSIGDDCKDDRIERLAQQTTDSTPSNHTTTIDGNNNKVDTATSLRIRILYGTCTGTSRDFAQKLAFKIKRLTKLKCVATDLRDYNPDDIDTEEIVFVIVSTWTDGEPNEATSNFFYHLKDLTLDFRISKNHLKKLKYSIFGLGGAIYEENFCRCAKEMDVFMRELGGTVVSPVEFGDDASDIEKAFHVWCSKVIKYLQLNVMPQSALGMVDESPAVDGTEGIVAGEKTEVYRRATKPKRVGGKAASMFATNVVDTTEVWQKWAVERKLHLESQTVIIAETNVNAKTSQSVDHSSASKSDGLVDTDGTADACACTDSPEEEDLINDRYNEVDFADEVKTDSHMHSTGCCSAPSTGTSNIANAGAEHDHQKSDCACSNNSNNSNAANNTNDAYQLQTDNLSPAAAVKSPISQSRRVSFDSNNTTTTTPSKSIVEHNGTSPFSASSEQKSSEHSKPVVKRIVAKIPKSKAAPAPTIATSNNTDANDVDEDMLSDTSSVSVTHSDSDDELENSKLSNVTGELLDLEELGTKMLNSASGTENSSENVIRDLSMAVDANTANNTMSIHNSGNNSGSIIPNKNEMVTKLQRKALTKEGYKIIGTHSAVKLCRWTKNQMRGRGGCYKHSFYGITSYQCMEATPSLACANKCVFCWRHHKNPVGTDWRWKEDEPGFIVSEAIELHRSMIYQMRGVPGVQQERYVEAFNVKHCALSLVGEPIMYPRINEMLFELHCRGISSFLVTNAQFPQQMETLDPVTQLYVSVDASTKDSLKAIDRPLFKDFWERYLQCLATMKTKQQRTVYRMTLVKAWNMQELEGYAELIEFGLPAHHSATTDFIEIKGVTFCGKSDASSLTMENVPWHHEVCYYGEGICDLLRQRGNISVHYSIATEHEHSNCILLAREDKFKPNGQWHTWIDYDKFNLLIEEYYRSGKQSTFSSLDYIAETPSWAIYQSPERGFDPIESRWRRNKAGATVEIEYKSTESGCG